MLSKYFEKQSTLIANKNCGSTDVAKEVRMSQPLSVKEAERRAFQAATDDGLWDVLLGCVFLMFALAPLLSAGLGDFWSAMIFLPFWGLVYLGIRLVRREVVAPRVGVARFGKARRARITKVVGVLAVVNLLALALGLFAVWRFAPGGGSVYPLLLGLLLLVGFSVAGYLLDYNRLFVYGLLVGVAPLAGEWLSNQGLASHHGFPLAFGFVSAVMIVTGLGVFGRLLRDNPRPDAELRGV